MDREPIDLLRTSYNALLGRDPDLSAEADWAATQKVGRSLPLLLNRILYSSEFAQRWKDVAIVSEPSD